MSDMTNETKAGGIAPKAGAGSEAMHENDIHDPKTGYSFAEYVQKKMNGELDSDEVIALPEASGVGREENVVPFTVPWVEMMLDGLAPLASDGRVGEEPKKPLLERVAFAMMYCELERRAKTLDESLGVFAEAERTHLRLVSSGEAQKLLEELAKCRVSVVIVPEASTPQASVQPQSQTGGFEEWHAQHFPGCDSLAAKRVYRSASLPTLICEVAKRAWNAALASQPAAEGVPERPEVRWPASQNDWRAPYDGKGMYFATEANVCFDQVERVICDLRKERDEFERKAHELCCVLGNLGIYIHELGLRAAPDVPLGGWKYTNFRAETAEQTITDLRAQIAAAVQYEFLLPGFLAAMNDIGRYGHDKYGEDSFQHRAKIGDTSRWMDRVQPEEIMSHAHEHFQMAVSGVLHDKFGTVLHQLAASAFNAMMEAHLSGSLGATATAARGGEEATTLSGHSRAEWHKHIDRLFEIAIPGEDIPWNAIHAWTGKPTAEDMAWARKVVADLESAPPAAAEGDGGEKNGTR